MISTIGKTRKAKFAMLDRRKLEIRLLNWLVNFSNFAVMAASVWAVAGHEDRNFNIAIVVAATVALLSGAFLTWNAPEKILQATYEKCKEMATLMTEVEQSIHGNKCDGEAVLAFDKRYQSLVGGLDENHEERDFRREGFPISLFSGIVIALLVATAVLFPAAWLLRNTQTASQPAPTNPSK